MQNWERLTRQANRAYSNHDFSSAVELNRQALRQAEMSFDEDFCRDAESAVAAAAVSFLNIAESYTALGDFISANTQYENAVNFLQAVIVRADMNDEQRDLIMRTATHLRFEWELFSQSYGKRLLSQGRALMESLNSAIAGTSAMVRH
ncbi:tetratricopeptide repeat protein [Marinomonas sp. M1K-6]|uniref:Tetratricopeptide repeat protein n=1 Tax=Marinomonas profundi TaxID=2726122 RepID=A0A847R205_9GAMM|nr:tetratricopeptide repeat protein [Marinomonas profundi]NLQ17831.1 tetratricopeptide repeat protein [Marinomonas profundi]UDV03509.1 tetratricopeptide repeat protein [Marinomonas profundi]